jgi:hypothetical protein
MNEHTRARLEAILGPIQDDDELVDKVLALDGMLTRYLRDSLERSAQDELRDQIALDRRKALQSMPQTMPRCTCGLVFTNREDAVEHAKRTLHAVRGLFHAGTPSSEEP